MHALCCDTHENIVQLQQFIMQFHSLKKKSSVQTSLVVYFKVKVKYTLYTKINI